MAILGLFFSSTIAVFANAAFYLVELPSALGASEHDVNGLLDRLEVLIAVARRSNVRTIVHSALQTFLSSFQYVMCDAVLVWRAWCLWQDHRLAKALLLTCMCGSIGEVSLIIILFAERSTRRWEHHRMRLSLLAELAVRT